MDQAGCPKARDVETQGEERAGSDPWILERGKYIFQLFLYCDF